MVTFRERCSCGAEYEVTVEPVPAEVEAWVEAMTAWRKDHENRCPVAESRARAEFIADAERLSWPS